MINAHFVSCWDDTSGMKEKQRIPEFAGRRMAKEGEQEKILKVVEKNTFSAELQGVGA